MAALLPLIGRERRRSAAAAQPAFRRRPAALAHLQGSPSPEPASIANRHTRRRVTAESSSGDADAPALAFAARRSYLCAWMPVASARAQLWRDFQAFLAEQRQRYRRLAPGDGHAGADARRLLRRFEDAIRRSRRSSMCRAGRPTAAMPRSSSRTATRRSATPNARNAAPVQEAADQLGIDDGWTARSELERPTTRAGWAPRWRCRQRGRGRTAPNPNVGCVIVRDGRVVGRGWTQPGGRPHAEAMALAEAGDAARGATAYVTLEPCAHASRARPGLRRSADRARAWRAW